MDAARCVGFQPTLAFGSGIGGLKCYDIKGGIGKCSVDRPILTDQVRRDMRLIALPTSDGGSIAPAAWDIRRNPPRLVVREWCRRCASHRNRHTQVAARWRRLRQSTLLIPRIDQGGGKRREGMARILLIYSNLGFDHCEGLRHIMDASAQAAGRFNGSR